MRKEDFDGLTAKELQDKFSLPMLPDRAIEMSIPANTEIIEGLTESNFETNKGGGWQVYIITQAQENWVNIQTIKEIQ